MAAPKVHLKAAEPKPGKKLQVIGAGLPRTGTNSFCAAVSILLDGPSYHIGVQTVLSSERSTRKWIEVLSIWPPSNAAQKQRLQDLLTTELDGFVCIADPPGSLLVPELMELYPDAKVLVTTREKNKWIDSMDAVRQLIIPYWMGRLLYFWVPTLHLLPTFWYMFPTIFVARHGQLMEDREGMARSWEAHAKWLREVVPEEKLFEVDVKEGWGPFCEALGVEVPEGVEFPRLNDGKDMEELFKGFAIQGLQRWGLVLGLAGVVSAGLWWYL